MRQQGTKRDILSFVESVKMMIMIKQLTWRKNTSAGSL